MRKPKIFSYPLPIYAIWLTNFIAGMEFIGVFLTPFFTDWGGLNQFQILTLQALFMVFIFLLEVPTGMIGDRKGLKWSVAVGYIFLIIAPLVYISHQSFWIFLLGEFLFAVGFSFISGSDEALLYETVKQSSEDEDEDKEEGKHEDKDQKEDFSHINNVGHNFRLIGMIASSLIAGYLVSFMSLPAIFALTSISSLLALILLMAIVKEPKRHDSLAPDYRELLRGLKVNLLQNKRLLWMAIAILIVSNVSYYVIWTYQIVLEDLNIPYEWYGKVRVWLLVSEIVISSLAIWLNRRISSKAGFVLWAAVIAVGFILIALYQSPTTILIFLALSGGVGLKIRNIYSGQLNQQIESGQRATVLSGISMIRRLMQAITNPIIGGLIDIVLYPVMFGLGLLSLVAAAIFPKGK